MIYNVDIHDGSLLINPLTVQFCGEEKYLINLIQFLKERGISAYVQTPSEVDLTTDKTGRVTPPYLKIANIIRERIVKGDYIFGQRLPSYMDFAEEFDVTTNTVKAGLEVLQYEGKVAIIKSKGVYIRNNISSFSPDTSSTVPLYLQVFNYLKGQIESKNYKSNDKLPSYKELSEIWGVSQNCVKAAVKMLLYKNIVYIWKGKGIYVR